MLFLDNPFSRSKYLLYSSISCFAAIYFLFILFLSSTASCLILLSSSSKNNCSSLVKYFSFSSSSINSITFSFSIILKRGIILCVTLDAVSKLSSLNASSSRAQLSVVSFTKVCNISDETTSSSFTYSINASTPLNESFFSIVSLSEYFMCELTLLLKTKRYITSYNSLYVNGFGRKSANPNSLISSFEITESAESATKGILSNNLSSFSLICLTNSIPVVT